MVLEMLIKYFLFTFYTNTHIYETFIWEMVEYFVTQ